MCETKWSVSWNKVACLKESSEVNDFYLKTGSGFEGLGGTSRRYRPKLFFTARGHIGHFWFPKKKNTSSLEAKCKTFHVKIIFVYMRREWSYPYHINDPYQWFYTCPGLSNPEMARLYCRGSQVAFSFGKERKLAWTSGKADTTSGTMAELVTSIQSNKNLSFISLCL